MGLSSQFFLFFKFLRPIDCSSVAMHFCKDSSNLKNLKIFSFKAFFYLFKSCSCCFTAMLMTKTIGDTYVGCQIVVSVGKPPNA